jgi:hypothetical protein
MLRRCLLCAAPAALTAAWWRRSRYAIYLLYWYKSTNAAAVSAVRGVGGVDSSVVEALEVRNLLAFFKKKTSEVQKYKRAALTAAWWRRSRYAIYLFVFLKKLAKYKSTNGRR